MDGQESPDWSRPDASAEDEEALYGAHTPVWSVQAPTPDAGATWAMPVGEEPPPEEPTETPEDSSVYLDEPVATYPEAPAVAETVMAPMPYVPPVQAVAPQVAPVMPAPTTTEPAAPDLTSVLAGEEITGVLQAAEQAARRIVERAQESAQAQLDDMRRQRAELEDHAAELAVWREQLAAATRPLAAEIEGFRAALEEIPARLSEALAMVADRVPAIQQDLADLARALGPATRAPAQQPPDQQARLAG